MDLVRVDLMRVDLVAIDLVRIDLVTPSPPVLPPTLILFSGELSGCKTLTQFIRSQTDFLYTCHV